MIILIILVGGLTRLTDSGLSITSWELFVGLIPPLTNEKWIEYFDLYKKIPEYSEQNFNMSLNEFKIIFWWEWAHRQLGRLIGLFVMIPMIYFSLKNGLWIIKKYGIIFVLICIQGFLGWYMVSSGLVNRVDVSHYRLSIHLFTAFIILSLVFWQLLQLTNLKAYYIPIKLNSIRIFLFLLFLQLIIGAFVSGMDAGKVYNTWPLMGSSFFPDDSRVYEFFSFNIFEDPSLVQFIHRNLAYLIVIVYIYLFVKIFSNNIKILRTPIILIGFFLLIQISLGVFTLLSGVKIIYASLHQINSIFIILSTLYLLYISSHKKV
tara:strand:- start:155 stop:1111 length:957 start_codon:yes stop_codon:yes gene_type:complete